jgi:hypothetical protein
MPDGSSSAAPVITPGPSDFNSNRSHRTGAKVGATESGRTDLFIAIGNSVCGISARILVVKNDIQK